MKIFVLHEEVIDSFHNNLYMTKIEQLSFHVAYARIIDPMECGKTGCNSFQDNG